MNNLDDLLFSVAETDDENLISQLLDNLKQLQNLKSDDIKAGIDFLLESWGGSIEPSSVKSQFCCDLALLSPTDSSLFRVALQRAFNNLNKSLFSRSAIVKATGVKNTEISLRKVVERFHIIGKLSIGVKVFNPKTKRIGLVEKLDDMTSEVMLKWDGIKLQQSVISLDAALRDLIFFKDHKILSSFASITYKLPSQEWRETLTGICISFPDNAIFEQLALAVIAEQGVDLKSFRAWWKGEKKDTEKTKITNRHPSDARTVHELHTLLENYDGGGFSKEEFDRLDAFFKNMKPGISSANAVSLIESLIILQENIKPERIIEIGRDIKDIMPFWPSETEIKKGDLSAWNKISSKAQTPFAKLTASVFSIDYLVELILQLPVRCWNGIIPVITMEIISTKLIAASTLSSDAVMWLWRNRKNADDALRGKLTPGIVADAINRDIENSASQAGKLKELMIGNRDFHMQLLENIKGSEMDLLRAVQTCDALRMDEKQSMLVKCAALSSEVRKYIEKGDGQKMFASAGRKHVEQKKAMEMAFTSVYSFNLISKELNDIITKQIPDNSAAIAHARSYGDLRENAEYKAAKERQAFLQNRRAELEHNLLNTQATDFAHIKPGKIALPGSAVTLKHDDDNSEETFYLLGVWDSDPDKKYLSSASRLGKILDGKAEGDSMKLPDGREATIAKVAELPEEILEIMAG